MQLTWRHDDTWRIRDMSKADALAIAGWEGALHPSPTHRSVLEHEGRLQGVASIVVDGRSGHLGEILVSPTCTRPNLVRLLRDIFLRYPTQIGLRRMTILLEIGTPIVGQSTDYAIQQCEWGALNDSVQAVSMDLGYLVASVEGRFATLVWENPSH